MTGRYRIHTQPAPPGFVYPARFRLGEGDDYVKYGHAPFEQGRRGGDPHWTAEVITQTWYQAETGRIPISGAGYGGPFAGSGFDGIWLDMSEIVRPTRDGIHGRESISTSVILGRRLPVLQFDASGRLISDLPPHLEIPIPVLFDPLPLAGDGPLDGARLAVVRAAARLGTLALVRAEDEIKARLPRRQVAGTSALAEASEAMAFIVPLPSQEELRDGSLPPVLRGGRAARLVEVEAGSGEDLSLLLDWVGRLQAANPDAVVGARLPLGPQSPRQVEQLVEAGMGLVHLCADEVGYELVGGEPRFVADVLQEVHGCLVDSGQRDLVTLVVSGGIAAAEHLPKALVCGADAVALDLALVVALGCALWADVRHPCPVESGQIDAAWGEQRLVNLMAAWRDQLLEVLGAMGMREVRRLRGELGRTIFQAKEEDSFRRLFGRAASDQAVVESREPGDGELEGDLRWPTALILSTAEQARTGQPPTSGVEYRVGRSGGGFDRLRFCFELERAGTLAHPGTLPAVQTPLSVDLSLDLNRRDPPPPPTGSPIPGTAPACPSVRSACKR